MSQSRMRTRGFQRSGSIGHLGVRVGRDFRGPFDFINAAFHLGLRLSYEGVRPKRPRLPLPTLRKFFVLRPTAHRLLAGVEELSEFSIPREAKGLTHLTFSQATVHAKSKSLFTYGVNHYLPADVNNR
ncbi:hypothetical protein [Xanthomonas arboricola]|uniref:hypothetical protein n=1 Tax=Xanthomonas arboricola TaxID=56448 RepID=UPI001374E847|nr:hypothetical protein [Xanthomonas arboricola]